MGDMSMPGDWTLSMIWMRMPDQSWLGAAAMFLAMWVVMTAVMMLPSLAPSLWRYHRAACRTAATSPACLTAWVGVGYLVAWTAVGVAIFVLGAALAAIAMRHPAVARLVPILAGAVVVTAGVVQCSEWKARHLACCQASSVHGGASPTRAGNAWRHGLRLGVHCCCSCAALMAVGLALGVMNTMVMSLVAMAVTAERLAPAGARVARGTAVAVLLVGILLVVRATGAWAADGAAGRAVPAPAITLAPRVP